MRIENDALLINQKVGGSVVADLDFLASGDPFSLLVMKTWFLRQIGLSDF